MTEFESVDLDEVRDLLKTALLKVEEIDRATLPDSARARDRSAAIAALCKELLFLAHVCDKARIHVLDEYQATRGFTDHYTH